MSLLIRNGTVVTHRERRVEDVRCRGGSLAALGPGLEPEAGDEVLDASGCLVLPGGVDPHVHMSLPVAGTVSCDDFASGTAAAVAGGTTAIVDFVHPERGEDFVEALEARKREAAGAVCDVGFHLGVTWWGPGTEEAMRRLIEEEGVPTFKVYLAYKETVGLEDRDLVEVLAAAGRLGGRVLVHAEHGDMVEHLRARFAAEGQREPKYHALSRPPELEGEATHRAAALAAVAGASLYVVHVTCRDAVEAVAAARARGWPVHAETCPQYLLLDDAVYEKPDFEGAAYVIAPPIRPRGHQEALWEALMLGTLDVVATDHCPFTQEQKRLGREDFRRIPGGAAGVEHRLALLWTHGVGQGRIDPHRFVDLVSTAPAKLFGLYPRKGAVAVGSDADLVIWDPQAAGTISAATHHHRTDRSIYEGFEVRGLPRAVVVGGKVAYRDGELTAEPGAGRFLRRRLG
jgi:dihydropyrimidinase